MSVSFECVGIIMMVCVYEGWLNRECSPEGNFWTVYKRKHEWNFGNDDLSFLVGKNNMRRNSLCHVETKDIQCI